MANDESTLVAASDFRSGHFSQAALFQFLSVVVPLMLSLIGFKPAWAGGEHGHNHSDSAHSLKAHVHGVAELEVAAFGKHRVVALFSPAANLLGFEHAASTPAQIEKVKSVEQLLKEKTLVSISPSTACRLTNTDTDALKDFSRSNAQETSEHRDLEIVWQYECTSPTALTHIDASALFAAFGGLEQLNVSVASEAGQTGGRLNPTSATLTLPQ